MGINFAYFTTCHRIACKYGMKSQKRINLAIVEDPFAGSGKALAKPSVFIYCSKFHPHFQMRTSLPRAGSSFQLQRGYW